MLLCFYSVGHNTLLKYFRQKNLHSNERTALFSREALTTGCSIDTTFSYCCSGDIGLEPWQALHRVWPHQRENASVSVNLVNSGYS